MINDPIGSSGDLSIDDERQIIEALDAYERQLKAGEHPAVSEWLPRVEPHLRPALEKDLRRLSAEFETIAIGVDMPEPGAGETLTGQANMLAETTDLLRIRLRAASIIICVAVGIFFVRSLAFPDWRLPLIRIAAISTAAFMVWRLRPSASFSIRTLRTIEVVLLIVMAIHTVALQASEMLAGVSPPDEVAVNTSLVFAYATWCVINMAYGTLIPNRWRRATIVLLAMTAIPFTVSLVAEFFAPKLSDLLRPEFRYAGGLLTLVASGAAIGSAYTVNHLRKELFRAKRFGRYRLVKRLGGGGMGEVFLAEHQLLKRPSAIKLIRPGYDTNEEAVRRFEREVQATAALSHWNTVEIFDYGRTDDGAFYYVMEYLEGLSLQQLVDQHGPLPPARVVFFLQQLCGALHESHSAGLVHRDIKPANIFAARCGSQHDVAKLLDFGLVHEQFAMTTEGAAKSATRFVGTPRFLSPEQATQDAEIDPRSDIYSLGATAFFLLTGRPPFNHTSLRECIHAHLHDTPVAPSTIQSDVPQELDAVVLRCLAKSPADRFADSRDLARALSECEFQPPWDHDRASEWWAEVEATAESSVNDEERSSSST